MGAVNFLQKVQIILQNPRANLSSSLQNSSVKQINEDNNNKLLYQIQIKEEFKVPSFGKEYIFSKMYIAVERCLKVAQFLQNLDYDFDHYSLFHRYH